MRFSISITGGCVWLPTTMFRKISFRESTCGRIDTSRTL